MKISATSHPALAVRLAMLVGGVLAVKSAVKNLAVVERFSDDLAAEGVELERCEKVVGEAIGHLRLSGDEDTALAVLVSLIWADIEACYEAEFAGAAPA